MKLIDDWLLSNAVNRTSNNLIIYNGYPLSVVVAVLLHSAVLATLLYLQGNSSSEALELVQPTVITALFIDENPQIRNEQNIERRQAERVETQRREREEAERQQQLEEQQRQEEQERIDEANRLEEERQATLLREETARREADERARELERQRELELERQRELERQEQLEREERDRAEQQRLRELAEAERQAEAAAEGARTELQLVQSATGLIQQIVQESWSRPPSARNGMRAILRIAMVPTGEVTEATIIESSGDPAFDRSAENAVYRAAPFTELQALPIRLFNQNFRTLQLVFQPEDLLN